MQLSQYEELQNAIRRQAYQNRSCRAYFDVKSVLPVQGIPNEVSVTIDHTKAALKRGLISVIKSEIASTGIWGVVYEKTLATKTQTFLQIMVDPSLVKDITDNLSERRRDILLERLENLGWNNPVNSGFKGNPQTFVSGLWNWSSRNHYRNWIQNETYRCLSKLKMFEEIQLFLCNRYSGLMVHSMDNRQNLNAYNSEREVLSLLKVEIRNILGDTPSYSSEKESIYTSNWYHRFITE